MDGVEHLDRLAARVVIGGLRSRSGSRSRSSSGSSSSTIDEGARVQDGFVAACMDECTDVNAGNDEDLDSESDYEAIEASSSEAGEENAHEGPILENEAQKERYIINSVRQWATTGGYISMTKVDDLLRRLGDVYPNMPKSYKTLLQTPKKLPVIYSDGDSEMWYKGIEDNLHAMQLDEYLEKYQEVEMDSGIDGLPLNATNFKKFWPILGRLVKARNSPFIIAIYHGKQDPTNVYEFLYDFVQELKRLRQNGFTYKGHVYQFKVRHFILDRPARSLVKCCVNHNGHGACGKV